MRWLGSQCNKSHSDLINTSIGDQELVVKYFQQDAVVDSVERRTQVK